MQLEKRKKKRGITRKGEEKKPNQTRGKRKGRMKEMN
jgi:hypothetical protein